MNEEEDLHTRESYTVLRERYGVDNSEDGPMLPPEIESASDSPNRKGKGKAVQQLPEGMMNDLRSISELRNKGEARRFLDEVGYLFEGLDPEGTVGVRRGRCAFLPELRRSLLNTFSTVLWKLSRNYAM